MTQFEYTFQDPTDPLIVDPFAYGHEGDQALAIRVIPPALANSAAGDMLQLRTTVLQQIQAPEEVLARYDPNTERDKQVGYIAKSGPATQYLSAVVGPSTYIKKLTQKDEQGLPVYSNSPPLEVDEALPEEIQAYLRQQVERRHKETSIEHFFQTVGLAKLTYDEYEGVRVQAIDVHPNYRRQSIASMLLYKGFGAYGNHAGVQPRQEKSEVQFYGMEPMIQQPPLIVQAEASRDDMKLLFAELSMGFDEHEYMGELRTVQAVLFGRLAQQGLVES